MKVISFCGWICGLCAATSGCAESGGEPIAVPVPADPVFAALCDNAVRCELQLGALFASRDECLARMPALMDPTCATRTWLNTQEEINACVTYLSTVSCERSIVMDNRRADLDNPCGVLVTALDPPRAVAEESCDAKGCVVGHYCKTSSEQYGCPICTPRGAAGTPCLWYNSLDCTGDTYCGDNGLCVALEENGADCWTDGQCQSGWCWQDACRTPLARQATCTAGMRCAGNLVCIGGACTNRPGIDGDCDTSEICRVGNLCVQGKCTPAEICGSGGVNEPCLTSDGCVAGTVCSSTTSLCMALAGEGEACMPTPYASECATGLYCAGGPTGVCTKINGPGESCSWSEPCVDGYTCNVDTCDPLVPLDGTCTMANECATWYCDNVTQTCKAPPACQMP